VLQKYSRHLKLFHSAVLRGDDVGKCVLGRWIRSQGRCAVSHQVDSTGSCQLQSFHDQVGRVVVWHPHHRDRHLRPTAVSWYDAFVYAN